MTKPKLKIQNAPKAYKLDPEKFANAPQKVFTLVMCDTMYFSEDYKYFDVIKPYLDIPEEPKTLEQISQELDEKIDALIKTTKEKFECSQYFAEKRYNREFDCIIQDFEYAKEHGSFPHKLTFTIGDGLSANNFIVSGTSVESSFVIKQGKKHEGYYTNGNRRYLKYYMPTKPNFLIRFCMRTCLGFYWVDEKNAE